VLRLVVARREHRQQVLDGRLELRLLGAIEPIDRCVEPSEPRLVEAYPRVLPGRGQPQGAGPTIDSRPALDESSVGEAIDDTDGAWMADRQCRPYRFNAAAGRLTDEVQGRSFGGR